MPVSQRNAFSVSRVACIDQKADAHCQQLQPSERHDQHGTLQPKRGRDTQGDDAERQVKPPQLGWRNRAVSAQKPVNILAAYRRKAKYLI
jgi:hypothetical protein